MDMEMTLTKQVNKLVKNYKDLIKVDDIVSKRDMYTYADRSVDDISNPMRGMINYTLTGKNAGDMHIYTGDQWVKVGKNGLIQTN